MAKSVVKKVYLLKAAPEESGQFLFPPSSSVEDGNDTKQGYRVHKESKHLNKEDEKLLQNTTTHDPEVDTKTDKIPCPPAPLGCTDAGGGGDHARKGNKNDEDGNKNANSKERFITLLTSSKIASELVPVMIFEYRNLDELWRHLKNPAHHSGMFMYIFVPNSTPLLIYLKYKNYYVGMWIFFDEMTTTTMMMRFKGCLVSFSLTKISLCVAFAWLLVVVCVMLLAAVFFFCS